ncbi:MAG: hypothetical protein CL910_19475 [Deltaproteobacteria bacterium]|nr:hypothetical protein [Deltaproteobacteria bacterium]
MNRTPIPLEDVLESALGELSSLWARQVDLHPLLAEAWEIRADPYGNLARLVESALHPKTKDYLIVTDLERDAAAIRSFARRHFFAYRALRRGVMRNPHAREKLRQNATGFFGRVASVDVFRYIAGEARGPACVSLFGKAAVLLLPGFDCRRAARASLEGSTTGRPAARRIRDLSDPELLSFVVRLHTRHEAAHSEDGMLHLAGTRNRYCAEPESDVLMVLFARRDAALLGEDVGGVLESVAELREVAGETYFFCARAIRRALEVAPALLLRLEDREIAGLADAIADSVVPPFETLHKVERALSELWEITRSRAIQFDESSARRDRIHELLSDSDVECWLRQTIGGFERFGLCFEEHHERVLAYAQRFYTAGQRFDNRAESTQGRPAPGG